MIHAAFQWDEHAMQTPTLIRVTIAISCVLLLAGCNATIPHLSVYDGLLPPGYQVQDSPEQLNPTALRQKTVAVVTTTNFENYTNMYFKYPEFSPYVTDVADTVVGALRRAFKSVKAAPDFASAQEMKADYIALLDYHFTANGMGDVFITHGGLYLLDGKLRKVFEATGKAEADRGMFDIRGHVALRNALNGTMNQIIATTNAHLGLAQKN
jgi:hypothetical protein